VIKFLLTQGLALMPGSVKWLITRGLLSANIVATVKGPVCVTAGRGYGPGATAGVGYGPGATAGRGCCV
jgi:hypothetical protein